MLGNYLIKKLLARNSNEGIDHLAKSQWLSDIDESAQLIADNIFIGDTELTKIDFDWETGEFYQEAWLRLQLSHWKSISFAWKTFW